LFWGGKKEKRTFKRGDINLIGKKASRTQKKR